MTAPIGPIDALQDTLAAEHAAVYLFGVLGARTSETAAPALFAAIDAAYVEHRGRRDALTAVLTGLGVEPVAAAVAYELPAPAETSQEVTEVAAGLEARSQSAYSFLVGHSVGDQRRWAIEALTASAVRALAFGAEPEPLPGLGDLR